MKLAFWMLLGSVLSALILTMLIGVTARREIWLGMLAPLISAMASWIAMERRHSRQPVGMTRLLVQAFIVKAFFFAIYIVGLLKLKVVQPFPFIVSFACYYFCLHMVEAIGLYRLQTAWASASREFEGS